MSKQLNLEEMVDAARKALVPNVDGHVVFIQGAIDELAEALARRLGIACGSSEIAPEGTLCGFSPVRPGQPLPDALKPFDSEGDWEVTKVHKRAVADTDVVGVRPQAIESRRHSLAEFAKALKGTLDTDGIAGFFVQRMGLEPKELAKLLHSSEGLGVDAMAVSSALVDQFETKDVAEALLAEDGLNLPLHEVANYLECTVLDSPRVAEALLAQNGRALTLSDVVTALHEGAGLTKEEVVEALCSSKGPDLDVVEILPVLKSVGIIEADNTENNMTTQNLNSGDGSPLPSTPGSQRVIALLDAKDGIVRSFGAGVHSGDFPLPPEAGGFNFGQSNPRIDLDNGKTVWGCECWWGPEEKVKARFPDDWKWEVVDIDEHRAANSKFLVPDSESPRCPPETESGGQRV